MTDTEKLITELREWAVNYGRPDTAVIFSRAAEELNRLRLALTHVRTLLHDTQTALDTAMEDHEFTAGTTPTKTFDGETPVEDGHLEGEMQSSTDGKRRAFWHDGKWHILVIGGHMPSFTIEA